MWGLGEKTCLCPRNATDLSPPLKTHQRTANSHSGGPSKPLKKHHELLSKNRHSPYRRSWGEVAWQKTDPEAWIHTHPSSGISTCCPNKRSDSSGSHSVNQPMNLRAKPKKKLKQCHLILLQYRNCDFKLWPPAVKDSNSILWWRRAVFCFRSHILIDSIAMALIWNGKLSYSQ